MKTFFKLLGIISIIALSRCQNSKATNNGNENLLVNYLKENWETPENYIINKFGKHDYIILGESHRIKHNAELMVRLIPKLYKKGIYNFAIEFGAYPYQHLVDSLLNLPQFDRKLARTIMFKSQADWGFKEYIDIYEAAWKVNQTSSPGVPKFRIINLSPPFDPCKSRKEMFGGHDYDKCMADIVINELVAKNKKALIAAGAHHSFTKYHQPYYIFEENKLDGFTKTRMGNILYDTLKDRTFNIYLHSPWISNQGYNKTTVAPVNGVIDSIMRQFKTKKIGFDVYNSPLGDLTASDTYYAYGYPNFSLKMFCDGYIFQKHFEDYESMTMEEDFVNPENMNDFISYMKCVGKAEEELDSLDNEKINNLLFYDIKKYTKHLIK